VLAELTDVMSDDVSQDLRILPIGIDNNPWGQYQPFNPFEIIHHTTTDHKEGEQLEDRRNVGENSCNFGDGTDQRVQSLMFMMMMIKNWCIKLVKKNYHYIRMHSQQNVKKMVPC